MTQMTSYRRVEDGKIAVHTDVVDGELLKPMVDIEHEAVMRMYY
jgi:hypothetical protein